MDINLFFKTLLMSEVLCIDLSGKEPNRQVGVDRVVASGSLGDVMVSALPRNANNVGSIPVLGAIFPIFTHTHTHTDHTTILVLLFL